MEQASMMDVPAMDPVDERRPHPVSFPAHFMMPNVASAANARSACCRTISHSGPMVFTSLVAVPWLGHVGG